MKLYVVAIRDKQQDAYSQPAFVPAIGLAIRSFGDEINNTESAMYKHPDDYDLYQLGEFDNATGQFANLPQPKQIAIGTNLSAKVNGTEGR